MPSQIVTHAKVLMEPPIFAWPSVPTNSARTRKECAVSSEWFCETSCSNAQIKFYLTDLADQFGVAQSFANHSAHNVSELIDGVERALIVASGTPPAVSQVGADVFHPEESDSSCILIDVEAEDVSALGNNFADPAFGDIKLSWISLSHVV